MHPPAVVAGQRYGLEHDGRRGRVSPKMAPLAGSEAHDEYALCARTIAALMSASFGCDVGGDEPGNISNRYM
jgi:hypothetical protein